MVGAKKVGLVTVFARYGDTQNTKNSGADYDIDDVAQLLDIDPGAASKRYGRALLRLRAALLAQGVGEA